MNVLDFIVFLLSRPHRVRFVRHFERLVPRSSHRAQPRQVDSSDLVRVEVPRLLYPLLLGIHVVDCGGAFCVLGLNDE